MGSLNIDDIARGHRGDTTMKSKAVKDLVCNSPWKFTQAELALAADRAAARSRALRRVHSAPPNGTRDCRREAPEFEVLGMLTVKEARFAKRPASATVKTGTNGGAGCARHKSKPRVDDSALGSRGTSQNLCLQESSHCNQKGIISKNGNGGGIQYTVSHGSGAQNRNPQLRFVPKDQGKSSCPATSGSRTSTNARKLVTRARHQNMTARSSRSRSLTNRPARHIRVVETGTRSAIRPRPSTPMPSTPGQLYKAELQHRNPYCASTTASSKMQRPLRTMESKQDETDKSGVHAVTLQSIRDVQKLDKLTFTPVNLWVKSNSEPTGNSKRSVQESARDNRLMNNMKSQVLGSLHEFSNLAKQNRVNNLDLEEIPERSNGSESFKECEVKDNPRHEPHQDISICSGFPDNILITEKLLHNSTQLAEIMGIGDCWLVDELLVDARQHMILEDESQETNTITRTYS